MFAWHHVKIDPLTVRSRDHPLGAENIAVRAVLFQALQNISDLLFRIRMDRLPAPACEHIIRMVMTMVMVVMFVIVMMIMSAALTVLMVVVVVMVVMMLVVMLVSVVMLVVMFVSVVMLMIMFMTVMMPVVVFVLMMMVMTAALAVLMMMSALRAHNFTEQLFFQRLALFHRLQDLFTRELCDGCRNERSLVIKFPQQRHALLHLFRLRLVRTA